MQRVLLVEKELVQVGKHAVEGAEEQDEESEKGVADGVVCAIVEDADGVENIQLVLPTSVSRQIKLDWCMARGQSARAACRYGMQLCCGHAYRKGAILTSDVA